MHKILFTIGLLVFIISGLGFAQHRGDQFFFQGLDFPNSEGTRSLAMGGAFSAQTGDLNTIFYNPAGLADINKITLSYYGDRNFKLWREYQAYRPTPYFGSLSLFLEGLIRIGSYNDGEWDYVAYRDSSYIIQNPKMGVDPYSKDAADWQHSQVATKPINLALAIPLHDFIKGLVFAASYNQNKVLDYDKNATYLAPNPGYTFYGGLPLANGFGVQNVEWYRFSRQREGDLQTVRFALSYNVNEMLQVGAGLKYQWGQTDDYLGLNHYATISLVNQNQFLISLQKGLDTTYGTSKFKALTASLGAIVTYSKFNLGITLNLPYTMTRDWNYTRNNAFQKNGKDTVSLTAPKGQDKLKMPVGFTVGLNYAATKKLTLACDVEYIPYASADFQLAQPDTFFQGWVSQTILRFGLEYRVSKLLSLAAGYRVIPTSYVPDGAAIHDKGSVATSYTFGAGLNFFFGRFDLVYEFYNLKYYDSYYSNTNYNTELSNRMTIGYTYSF
jgi:hypothetical protein